MSGLACLMEDAHETEEGVGSMGILVHPFAPITDDKATCLILGSFPSVASRQNNFYYGNPRNRFWQVLGSVLGEEAPGDIPGKTQYLLRHGIALWDVLASCQIRGSGDASILDAVVNDIPVLLRSAPIRQIFCNGQTAGWYFRQYIQVLTDIQAVVLPSTSPANAAWRLDALIAAWHVIGTNY